MAGRMPGQRAHIDRGVVLDVARVLLAEGGLPGLTLRALAARLDVAPNTLYSHVRNKDDLLDALLDDVLADVPAPTSGDPRGRLIEILTGSYDVLLNRRELVPLYVLRQGAHGRAANTLGDRMREALEQAGRVEEADRAVRTLIIATVGFAVFAAGADPDRARQGELRGAFLDALGWLLDGLLDNTPLHDL